MLGKNHFKLINKTLIYTSNWSEGGVILSGGYSREMAAPENRTYGRDADDASRVIVKIRENP